MSISLRVLVLALVASVTLVAAAAARAGTYTVYGCQTPTGASAPLNGWQDYISSDTYWQGRCPGPMYLGMVDSESHADGETVELKFTAPPGTTISSYTLRRAVKLVSSDGYYFETLEESGGVWHLVNGCSSPAGCKPRRRHQEPVRPLESLSAHRGGRHHGGGSQDAVQSQRRLPPRAGHGHGLDLALAVRNHARGQLLSPVRRSAKRAAGCPVPC